MSQPGESNNLMAAADADATVVRLGGAATSSNPRAASRAPSSAGTMANNSNPLFSRVMALPIGKKLALAAGVMAAAAIIFSATQSVRGQSDWRVLFANVNERDGAAIIASLQQMNVPYRFTEGGGAIMVPGGVLHETRLKLAGQGLPKAGTIGFELLENQKLGTSQFVEQVNFQRGLEGELAKSIQGLAQVDRARVHLAIPKASAFVREQQHPSASVVLTMHPGRFLDEQQVVAITHLVSSSVPQLAPQAVTIVDSNGALLAPNPQRSAASGLDATQLKYVNEVESAFTKRIVTILEPIVGRDNVRAQVAVDVDFTQVELTEEKFRPNSPPNQAAIRSQQSLESNGGNTANGGVPGALSNQPPANGLAPIDAVPPPGGAGVSLPRLNSNARKEQTTNYELDRAISHTKNGRGQVKRVSAAVIVNYRSVPDKDGNAKPQAFSTEEMEQINALVRDTMGFSKERGDSVSVANIPFNPAPAAEELPIYKQPEVLDLAKEILKFGLLAIAIGVVVWGVIRPILFTRKGALAGGAGAEAEGMALSVNAMSPADLARERREYFQQERQMLEEERKRLESDLRRIDEETRREYDNLLDYAKQYVGKDSRVVASVVKDWLGGEKGGAKS
ncbi:MAG: hypothetical protein RIR70_530 [Pseudomonadota bacterium]